MASIRAVLLSSSVMLLVSGPALAQVGEAAPAAQPPVGDAAAVNDVDEIVVVGTTGRGVRRQDAAFAVTTVDSGAIQRANPQSTADLLRIVPGITVESSGGQNGANIFVRGFPAAGDAQFVTFQLEGVAFFPPPTLSFLENSQLIRIDETLDRVEAVRGGTGSLFGIGQPGLTVNVVQKKGGDEWHGLGKVSGTTFGVIRGDGYVSGPIGPNTGIMVGGYYAEGNGIRDPGFTAERGGQISANIRHRFDGGELLVFGRYLNDRGQWLLPIPIVQNGRRLQGFPGFDYGTGTLLGPETRRGQLNDGTNPDLGRGRGARIGNIGFNFDYELVAGLKVRDRFSWLSGSADTYGLVPATAPQSAADFAAGLGGGIGSLSFVNGGGAVSPDQQVVTAGSWVVEKDIDAYVNDLALEWKHQRNTLTVGFFYSHSRSRDRWNLGNNQLLTAEPNARRLDLVLADGRQATRAGFVGGATFRVDARYNADDFAIYVLDEWQVTDRLRLDGGVRWQQHNVDGRLRNIASVDLDNNPATLFNNNDTVFAPGFNSIRYRQDDTAGTIGINYEYSRELGAFFRFSHGNAFPFFDNLRDGLDQRARVDSYELGLKASLPYLRAYLTLFRNDFDGLATTQITNGAPIASVGGARTNGIELEGVLTPFDGLSLGFAATYLDAAYVDFFSNGGLSNDSGNRVQRQPEWQFRISPSYETRITDRLDGAIFSSFYYYGDRFSDTQNLQLLPEYIRWDLGATLTFNKAVRFQVAAENITNELGLTEGNPRLIGSQGSGAILARPILGRSVTFSLGYSF